MPQPGANFGDDQFGQRGFIPGDFRPSKVIMNEHWMAAHESIAKRDPNAVPLRTKMMRSAI